MNKLQTAVGESRSGDATNGRMMTQDEAENMYAEEIEGIREKMALQMAQLQVGATGGARFTQLQSLFYYKLLTLPWGGGTFKGCIG